MKNGGKLLQVLACQMNCTYLSDLRFLSERRREELAEKVKNLSSDVASLEEWNDALLYLTGFPESGSDTKQYSLDAAGSVRGAAAGTRPDALIKFSNKENRKDSCFPFLFSVLYPDFATCFILTIEKNVENTALGLYFL